MPFLAVGLSQVLGDAEAQSSWFDATSPADGEPLRLRVDGNGLSVFSGEALAAFYNYQVRMDVAVSLLHPSPLKQQYSIGMERAGQQMTALSIPGRAMVVAVVGQIHLLLMLCDSPYCWR
eukprot:SAG22_NODE_991_length_6129_cov_8.370813_9_plen_120_part_00